ncbi:helix-turn-helix domain-containing protein [Rummeliibacillus stabekisii]|uniref:helix-turn-helix domain-containing protein n=1 Tax=Rummeliibacillus stabekisii TaxID=241244 RepID=UPI00372494F9
MKKIKVDKVVNHSHSLMNDIILNTAMQLSEAEVIIKLDDLLKERGLTQKDLATLTGMRVGTISEIINGKGNTWNKTQLLAIMATLKITKLSDILEIRLPNQLIEEYEQVCSEWKVTREMPLEIKEQYRENLLKERGF